MDSATNSIENAGSIPSSVLSGAHTQASVTVSLHPLILVNISDHYTRTKSQNNGQSNQVIGAIIGKQTGRHLELTNSFELPYIVSEGHSVIDTEYFKTRENQYKEVFPDQEYLGWYNTGDLPTAEDVNLHKLYFSESNESPIFLKLNTQSKASDQLPVRIFESIIEIESGKAETSIQFLEISYTFVTEESERIGIDHVARCSVTNAPETSHVTEHFSAQSGAVKMLAPRMRLIIDYIQAVQSGKLPKNEELLRQISSLAACLPISQSDAFRQEYDIQCNDITLASYLGILTKQCASLNKLVNKINTVHEHRNSGPRGGRRAFFM